MRGGRDARARFMATDRAFVRLELGKEKRPHEVRRMDLRPHGAKNKAKQPSCAPR